MSDPEYYGTLIGVLLYFTIMALLGIFLNEIFAWLGFIGLAIGTVALHNADHDGEGDKE